MRVNQLRSKLGERLDSLPRVSGAEGEISLSNELIKILNLTDKLAQKRGDQYIASELFILAAMDIKGALADILKQAGANRDAVEKAIDEICVAASRWWTPMPRKTGRRWRNTPST